MSNEPANTPVTGVRWQEQIAIVDVAGDIDLSRSLDFQKSLLSVLDDGPQRIIVNLGNVRYMDSSGVASLVKLLARTRKCGCPLSLVGLTARVKSLFEITRLDIVFNISPTERDALS